MSPSANERVDSQRHFLLVFLLMDIRSWMTPTTVLLNRMKHFPMFIALAGPNGRPGRTFSAGTREIALRRKHILYEESAATINGQVFASPQRRPGPPAR